MFESKFRIVSIGIAAENKALNSYELPVAPIELFPLVDGELVESLDEIDVSGVNQDEVEYSVRIKTSSTITATWLQLGSNRVTAPDVRRGERLLLWQYADSDKYYWTSMGMDDEQRRLETGIWAWSATPEIDDELDLSENMYTIELSTHGKHITLHTTQANGEPFEYSLQLNTADGLFFITDQDGNSIQLNSAERIIKAINSDATEVTIDKTSLYAYAKDNVRARSDDAMSASCGGNMVHYVEGDLNQFVGGNWNVMVMGNKTEVVQGLGGNYHVGGHTTFSDGMVAFDGVGVNMQAGMAGPVDPGAIQDGTKGPSGGSGNDGNSSNGGDSDGNDGSGEGGDVGETPQAEQLTPEYGIKATSAIRDKAGRYAALDEPSEIGNTPSFFAEDSKPAGYTGKPLTVSTRVGTTKPTGTVPQTTEVGVKVDYSKVLGNTGFTVGDLSKDAVFPHRIGPQGGLTAQDIVWNMEALAEKILQPLEDQFGPFTVNAAFRVGSGSSQHHRGQAVDIQGPGWSPQKYMVVAEWIADNLPFDQLIFEHGNSIWLHISFDASVGEQRGQLLTMINGRYESGLKNYYA